MSKVVNVAAAVIRNAEGQFLLGRRADDAIYGGWWEFPGGKVEAGESPHDALCRELQEELGITVDQAWPWILREHHYEHAHVRLHFFEVQAWHGDIHDHVHSALRWQDAGRVDVEPMLPANAPVLKALALPRVMGITAAASLGVDEQLRRLETALAGGLQLVQLREATLAEEQRLDFAHQARALCRDHGALCIVNGDPGLAEHIAADGLHLPAAQLALYQERPPFPWVGASCHDRPELEQAARLGLDYAVLGPVHPTPTHPGQGGMGWHAFAALVRELPMPVLALGGVDPRELEAARASGAHGIAGIRSAWPPGAQALS